MKADEYKANRKGSREGEMEFGNRLKQLPYRNKKKYIRKLKHKKRGTVDGSPFYLHAEHEDYV